MGRINQEIIEFAFSAKSTATYELNVLIGHDSLYFMVLDAQLNVLALKPFHSDYMPDKSTASLLKDVFFEDVSLKSSYRITKIAYMTPHFTFVPQKFYTDAHKDVYLDQQAPRSEQNVVLADGLKDLPFKNVHLIDKQLLMTIQAIFPQAHTFHFMSPLILGCQKIAEWRTGHQVFANVRDSHVHILFFDGKDLMFANSFGYKSAKDVLYFILNVYEQFKLNPENIPLSLSGSLTEDSDIFKYIYKYIRHLSFISTPPYFNFGHQFAGVPQHFYFDLFSVKLCEPTV